MPTVCGHSLSGQTGPAAIGYLYIDADPNNADEMAVHSSRRSGSPSRT